MLLRRHHGIPTYAFFEDLVTALQHIQKRHSTIIIPSSVSSVIRVLCKKSIQCSICHTIILEHLALLCDKHYIELKQEFTAEEDGNFYCINLTLHRYIGVLQHRYCAVTKRFQSLQEMWFLFFALSSFSVALAAVRFFHFVVMPASNAFLRSTSAEILLSISFCCCLRDSCSSAAIHINFKD